LNIAPLCYNTQASNDLKLPLPKMEPKSAQTALTPQDTAAEEKRLTLKQRQWLKEYIENGGNATQAANKVYDCKNLESAAQIGWENLRKLDIAHLMEESGLTDVLLNLKLAEGLNSSKQIGARKIVQGARTGHEIKVDSTTEEDDFIEVPDMAVRHKYLETALKLKKHLVDRKDITTDGEPLPAVQVLIVEDNSMKNE
jgi:hypothetical protein